MSGWESRQQAGKSDLGKGLIAKWRGISNLGRKLTIEKHGETWVQEG
jgi:hypothetical protein